jgi:hypothetical protein
MKAKNNWEVTIDFPGTGVTVWEADAEDSNGRIWKGLAAKVTREGLTERVFVGESAWSDAERLAFDLTLGR